MRPPSLLSPCLKQFPDFVGHFVPFTPGCQILYNHIGTCFTLPKFYISSCFYIHCFFVDILSSKQIAIKRYCSTVITELSFLLLGSCLLTEHCEQCTCCSYDDDDECDLTRVLSKAVDFLFEFPIKQFPNLDQTFLFLPHHHIRR